MRRRKKRRNPVRTTIRYGIAAGKARRAKRKSPKRVAAGRKAARTRKRMASTRAKRLRTYAWKRTKGPSRRMTVRRTRRGLMRSPYSRIGYFKGRKLRVNPRRRYRRRNPQNMINRLLGQWRLKRAVPILVGFAGGIALKAPVQNFIIPKLPIAMQMPVTKWWGLLTIVGGAILSNKGRRSMTKDAGLGLIVAGLYDVIATNFASLPFIPKITAAVPSAATASGYGLGSSIGQGDFTVVGAANLVNNMDNDIVGDCDLDDLI